jgi:hypothetical protein
MERREIEGMLNRLGVKKDELSEQGKPLDSIDIPIAQLTIAQQLMLLVEQGTRPKVDCRELAKSIIEEAEETFNTEDDPESYQHLVSSITKMIQKAFNEK